MSYMFPADGDPRDPQTSRHTFLGDISQHQIDWHSLPNTPFKCVYAKYVTPNLSGGKTIAVVRVPDDFCGFVSLNTGYNGGAMDANERILHLPTEQLVVSNKFNRAESIGPLSICLVGGDGKTVVSDVAGNLGLPEGFHVCWFFVFAHR